ncbi:hypothetical protein MTO96_047353 [Rhipicephalus appendiculatus]
MLTRRDEQSKKSLLNQLSNIDAHLRKGGYRFLTGDTMCCFDCELMPRLQHIRVAGNRAAGRHFGVGKFCVRYWRRQHKQLKATKTRQAFHGPKTDKYPQVEAALLDYVQGSPRGHS